jgi:hypothetical protein
MVCRVCGKDLGFWAKLGSHSQICERCTEQGQNQLKVLATSIGGETNWNQQHAERWLSTYDETVRKYQVPPADATRIKYEILNSLFKLAELQPQLADADLKFLIALGQRYCVTRSGSPELQDTILRIDLRQAIRSWDEGEPPKTECTALVLAGGEVCHWEEPAVLLLQRVQREYVGMYGSVRMGRVRVGGFKSVPIDKTLREDGGRGLLHITNQRVCFTGTSQALAIPFAKIVSLAGFSDGFEVHTGNEKKPGIFLVPHPELTIGLLKRASSSIGEDESRPRRRKKASSLSDDDGPSVR